MFSIDRRKSGIGIFFVSKTPLSSQTAGKIEYIKKMKYIQ